MSAISRSVLFTATLSLFGTALLAQDGKPVPTPVPAGHEKPKEAKDTFAVVQVGHELTAVAESGVDGLRKEKHAAFEQAKAAYDKAKAAAEASKQPFDQKPPKEEAIIVKKGGIASLADAQKLVATMKQVHKDKAEKGEKTEKGEGHEHGGKKHG